MRKKRQVKEKIMKELVDEGLQAQEFVYEKQRIGISPYAPTHKLWNWSDQVKL
jgi:hypothetical protein